MSLSVPGIPRRVAFAPSGTPAAVPDELRAFLFADGGACWALLDAALVPGLPETVEHAGLEALCLYAGEAAQTLADTAPWLVRLDPDSRFTVRLFARSDAPWDLWGKARAVLVRSPARSQDLRRHFRRFLRAREDSQNAPFFRFYDGMILADWVEGNAHRPARAAAFLGVGDDGAPLCHALALDRGTGEAEMLMLMSSDLPPPETSPWRLDDGDRAALAAGVERRMVARLADRLRPVFTRLEPAHAGQADDYAAGAVDFVRRMGDGRTALLEDCYQLALLSFLLGPARNDVLAGPVISEQLVPVSHRIALVRESLFAAMRQAEKEDR
jgi:hypothetical protein